MDLDAIRASDTDAFQFDFTAWFASISGTPTFSSTRNGFAFSGGNVLASLVSVYATAPSIPGIYTIACTATDGSPRVLTLERQILVVS